MKDLIVRDVVTGKKHVCLAISEPYAGSDVSAIRTTAVKSADGKSYIVNGEKKWYGRTCVVTVDAEFNFSCISTAVINMDGMNSPPWCNALIFIFIVLCLMQDYGYARSGL